MALPLFSLLPYQFYPADIVCVYGRADYGFQLSLAIRFISFQATRVYWCHSHQQLLISHNAVAEEL